MENVEQIVYTKASKEINKITLTRKIQLFIDVPRNDEESLKKHYKKLYTWQKIAFKASNIMISHLFFQEQVKELFYFQDDIKLKLINRDLDEMGMLNTSHENSIYRVISNKFKSEIPMAIISCLSQDIYKRFTKERSNYFEGTKSLSSYKNTIPVPFTSVSIHDLVYDNEIKNFRFNLFKDDKIKIPFRTYLGRDASNNKMILERCMEKEYKLCNSSYIINQGKIFLLLNYQIIGINKKIDSNIKAKAILSFLAPVIINLKGKDYYIGDKESFLYKRLAIQSGLKRRQEKMKFNSGGRGRKQKIHGINVFKKNEVNFIDNFTHNISSAIIKLCIANKIGILELVEIKQTTEDAQKFPFVIRNWSYGNLIAKIKYKSEVHGIKLVYN